MVCVISVLTTATLTTLAYVEAKRQMVDVGGEMFAKINHDVLGLMDACNNQVKAGKMTLPEAQELVRTYANGPKLPSGDRDISKTKLSIDSYTYVWAFTYKTGKGDIVMHPFALEGHNGWDFNIKGKYTVRDSWGNIDNVDKVFREIWQNPGEPVYTFLAYQAYYEPWDWIVGVGGREELMQKARLEHLAPLRNKLLLWGGATLAGSLLLAGLLMRGINRSLSALANRLSHGAQSVTSATTQVSSASNALAAGASEQAASVEETSSSLEELSSIAKRTAENSHRANELSKQTRSAAEKGVADMQEMNAAMQATKASSDEIAKIIKTIDEIAFQTNILALNAAVEAARAGEAGMGFAVVADEVRNLAQRSAQAAKETAAKIEGAIVKNTQGMQLTSKVAETLNDIAVKARQVDELAAQLATASQEQVQSFSQISTAMGRIDQVTQSNAAGAEESAAAVEDLNGQAMVMNQTVDELLQLVEGSQTLTAVAPVPLPQKSQAERITAGGGHGARSSPARGPESSSLVNHVSNGRGHKRL